MRANFKIFPKHEVVKKADRICKTSREITLNFDANNNEVPKFCSKVYKF